jgi:hypothetical protein
MPSAPTLAPVLAVLFAASLAAQGVRGGDFVVTDFASDTVFRVTPAGAVSVLHAGAPLLGPSGIAVTQQREVLVADFSSNTLFRIPPGGSIVPVVVGLQGPLRVAVDRNGDYLVSERNTASLTRVTPGGAVSTIHAGPPFVRIGGIAVDGSGDYLVADEGALALFRVPRAGGVPVPVHQGAPFRLPQGVALFRNGDFAVFDGIVDAVFRVPRAGGSVTTLVGSPPLGNPCGIDGDFEGGFVVSESSASSNRVVLVSQTGAVSVVAQGAPFSNLEYVARVPRLRGPVAGLTPGSNPFDLDVPGDANAPYLMWACLSLYPGFDLAAPDARGSPCNPDGLFFATAGLNNAAFTGYGGVLSASGQANASLNLPFLNFPPGLVLWHQAITIDVSAPNLVKSFTNVHGLPF